MVESADTPTQKTVTDKNCGLDSLGVGSPPRPEAIHTNSRQNTRHASSGPPSSSRFLDVTWRVRGSPRRRHLLLDRFWAALRTGCAVQREPQYLHGTPTRTAREGGGRHDPGNTRPRLGRRPPPHDRAGW